MSTGKFRAAEKNWQVRLAQTAEKKNAHGFHRARQGWSDQ